MTDQVVPGPCPSEGCPSPTQIDCVEVTKVYDFCFQSESRDAVCFDIPHSCGTVPAGSTATGTITSVTCTTASVVPILTPSGVPTGFANVTLLITVTESITITSPSGTTLCTFSGQFSFFKTVTLCAPTGTSITCEVPASTVGTTMIIGDDVCSTVTVCLLIESVATVKLLVPTYGFCTPAPCVVAPTPPFACPPSPLFPPQCVPVTPTTTPTPEPEEFPVTGPVV